MTGGLAGRVAIITGATQAMGETIASHLAARGAAIIGVGRSVDRGEAVATRLHEAGHDAQFVVADVSREQDVARAIGAAVARHGRLDIVVNNAAAFDARETAAHEESTDTFDAILKVGLYAPFWFAKYGIPAMISGARGGNFVNISSFASARGVRGLPAYTASKGGVEALTRQLAAEYADQNVRVNALVLGSIIVPRNAPLHDDEAASDAMRRARMIARPGVPDDVAAAVAFLVSDEAGFITGASISVDGGLLGNAPMIKSMHALDNERSR